MTARPALLLGWLAALLCSALAVVALVAAITLGKTPASAVVEPDPPVLRADEASLGSVLVADGLSSDPSAAYENSVYLQRLMNRLSYGGGGTLELPAGTFCFAATESYALGDYAIEARDNVKIVGAGEEKTILMPVGIWAETNLYEHGVDMFAYFGLESGDYLENADFESFTIDGSLAQGNPSAYSASGKGFFFKLFRNCDWLNVTVKNTDGTGFGMDFPINCTVRSCTAIACGKNATIADVGASGFGIGTGYSSLESIEISDCESYDNTKFGFFFEHQARFNSEIEAGRARGYVVSNCVASGNLYNFGGARAHDVTYIGCTSKIAQTPSRESYTARPFCFENHSYRIHIANCVVEQKYDDVERSDACFEANRWALSNGLLEGQKDGEWNLLFHPELNMTRAEAVALLWRYAGRPGDMVYGKRPVMPQGYADVYEEDYYIDAALWMSSIGDASLEQFRGNEDITRAELATMLWRMAEKPVVDTLAGFADVDTESYYAQAVAWGIAQGFISNDGLYFRPDDSCTRAEVVMLLYDYDAALAQGLVGEPLGGAGGKR